MSYPQFLAEVNQLAMRLALLATPTELGPNDVRQYDVNALTSVFIHAVPTKNAPRLSRGAFSLLSDRKEKLKKRLP